MNPGLILTMVRWGNGIEMTVNRDNDGKVGDNDWFKCNIFYGN